MIELHLRIRVAAARRDAFMAFLREAIPFYEQPGLIRVRLLEDMRDPTCFIEIVHYETSDAYELDQQRVAHDPAMQQNLQRWRGLLDGTPIVEVYSDATRLTRPTDHTPGSAP